MFDLGFRLGWWAKLDDAGCRIVTRLKGSTKLAVVARTACGRLANLSERIGICAPRQASSRRNPLEDTVSELRCAPRPAKSCAFSPMISVLGRRDRELTSGAGRSSCSSVGSSTRSKSATFSAHPRTPCAFRCGRLIAFCSCAWRTLYRTACKSLLTSLASWPQPHASTAARSFARTATTAHQRSAPVEPQSMPKLNRTAVVSRRASTTCPKKTWMAGTSPAMTK